MVGYSATGLQYSCCEVTKSASMLVAAGIGAFFCHDYLSYRFIGMSFLSVNLGNKKPCCGEASRVPKN
jgi:hypothetical protein